MSNNKRKSVLEVSDEFDVQELIEQKKDDFEEQIVKAAEIVRIVKIKPIKTYSRAEGNTNGVSILPGASLVLAPLGDGYGNITTGITEGEFKTLMPNFEGGYNAFFKKFVVRLTAEEKILNLSIPADYITYKFLSCRSEVAKSTEEISSLTKFILIDEEKEAAKSTTKADLKFRAMGYLNDMSVEDQTGFLKIFGISTRLLSPSVIRAKLIQIIENNPTTFLTKYSDKNKNNRILLHSLVQADILQTRGGVYYFNEEVIGASEDLAVEFLNNARNQETKINLIAALNAKTRL